MNIRGRIIGTTMNVDADFVIVSLLISCEFSWRGAAAVLIGISTTNQQSLISVQTPDTRLTPEKPCVLLIIEQQRWFLPTSSRRSEELLKRVLLY